MIGIPVFLLTLTMAGICYGYLRLTTGSIWPAAIAHSTFNVLQERFVECTAVPSRVAVAQWAGESGILTAGALMLVAALLSYRLSTRSQWQDHAMRMTGS